MFNSGRFWATARSGRYRQRMIRDTHPAAPRAPEPVCTRSQSIAYLDRNGRRIAVVHQYVRQDGTLGGSGMPDPKALLVGGVVYYVDLRDWA